jgi:hypothetical protein
LEQHPGVRITGELLWHEKDREWALSIDLTVNTSNQELVPRTSSWFIVLSPRFPWGGIEIYPAKKGGIDKTFPHQDHNGLGDERIPWRSGDLCVRAPAFALGRLGSDPDPKGDLNRLTWYAGRAIEWLESASAGKLMRDGDDFELPQCKPGPTTVGYSESEHTFHAWANTDAALGTLELVPLGEAGPFAARRFLDEAGKVALEPSWGKAICDATKPQVGAWIRLPAIPFVPPYGAPMQWGELISAMDRMGLQTADILRRALRPLRDGTKRILLVGFPIPRKVGQPPSLFHWQPMLLPDLSHGTKPVKGFPANERGYWLGDQATAFSPKRSLGWLTGRNWEPGQLGTRGQISPSLRKRNALFIGAGSLGSAVSELLVRGGLANGVVIDDDSLNAGNLVRHTLTLADVGRGKAEQLATHLNSLSPHAAIESVTAHFPELSPSEHEQCGRCDLLIDCSGSDDVLQALAEDERAHDALFVSISMGRGPKRLYLFSARGRSFPVADFRQAISRWLAQDEKEFSDTHFPWEGVGCWHPVFPARSDQVWAFAAAAARHLVALSDGCAQCGLCVLETPDEALFPQRAAANV